MSEPKKETVRIVLPNRNDGTPVPASPRENAMINLPPKPVAVPVPSVGGAPSPSVPFPVAGIPKLPSVPGIPKPPSSGGIPKPPSAPGIPRPPAGPSGPVLPSATVAPKAPMSAPIAPGGLAPLHTAPTPGPVGPAPIPLLAKKETAKVGGVAAPTKVLPQATVQFKRPSSSTSTSKSLSTNAPIIVSKPIEERSSSEVSPVLGAAVLVLSLAALFVQILMMLDFKAP